MPQEVALRLVSFEMRRFKTCSTRERERDSQKQRRCASSSILSSSRFSRVQVYPKQHTSSRRASSLLTSSVSILGFWWRKYFNWFRYIQKIKISKRMPRALIIEFKVY